VSDFIYRADAETPSFSVAWADGDDNLLDLSSGFTFTVELVRYGSVALTKTTGIAGAATSPNVVVVWSNGELAALNGTYELHLTATNGSNDRHFRPGNWPTVTVVPTPG